MRKLFSLRTINGHHTITADKMHVDGAYVRFTTDGELVAVFLMAAGDFVKESQLVDAVPGASPDPSANRAGYAGDDAGDDMPAQISPGYAEEKEAIRKAPGSTGLQPGMHELVRRYVVPRKMSAETEKTLHDFADFVVRGKV